MNIQPFLNSHFGLFGVKGVSPLQGCLYHKNTSCGVPDGSCDQTKITILSISK